MYSQIVLERPEELLDAANNVRMEGDKSPFIAGGKIRLSSIPDTTAVLDNSQDANIIWHGPSHELIRIAFNRLGLEVEFV